MSFGYKDKTIDYNLEKWIFKMEIKFEQKWNGIRWKSCSNFKHTNNILIWNKTKLQNNIDMKQNHWQS